MVLGKWAVVCCSEMAVFVVEKWAVFVVEKWAVICCSEMAVFIVEKWAVYSTFVVAHFFPGNKRVSSF